MSENNEKSNEEKEDKLEKIKVVAIICVFVITAMVSWKVIKIADNNSKLILHTLSSEELAGESYTERTAVDDYDMWETEVPDNTEALMALAGLSEPLLENVIEFPLDINLANSEELMQINGVGTVTAENIINYRNKYGYFSDYSQLLNIDGIGEKKLENLMKYIYISDEWLEDTTTEIVEGSVVSEVTTVPVSKTETTEAVTVTILATETTADIIIVNEEFVNDNPEDEYDFSEPIDDYPMFTTTHSVDFPLELNTATVKDLMCIDGIGESIALKIVEYAYRYGFYSVEDLLNVDGIGNSKLEAIRPYVYVDLYMLPTEVTIATDYFESELITESSVSIINVNTCGKNELMQLPGIDEEMAEKIISFRDTIGGFIKIEEIALVDGMTNEKMLLIWDYIYIQ